MSTAPKNLYDEVPYLSYPQEQAHPDRLATLARMYGIDAPPIETCRVLEIGCGTGGHLIPVAYTLPGSQCVGIDLAERPVELGRQTIAEMGLTNIRLEALNLMDLPADFGQFDYILAHGFYAWVPQPVRDKLLQVLRAHLSPNGVGLVSYNALPGGHLRYMVREMVLYHTRFIDHPLQKAEQGRALLEFLSTSLPELDPYRAFLQRELQHVLKTGDWLLCHDELSPFFAPVYFWQFMEHATRHGLQYLSETEFAETQEGVFSREVVETLQQLGSDVIAREQYWDFLKCRKFRQTLLVHKEVEIRRQATIEGVSQFRFAGLSRPVSATPSIRSKVPEKFEAHGGKASVETDNPLAKAVLTRLNQVYPLYPTFDELVHDVREMLNPGAAHDGSAEDLAGEQQVRKAVSEILLRTFAAALIEFHVYQPPYVTEAGPYPEVFKLARMMAPEQENLPTLRMTSVQAGHRLTRSLVVAADGTRDRDQLAQHIAAEAGLTEPDELAAVREKIDENLKYLAQQALLVR